MDGRAGRLPGRGAALRLERNAEGRLVDDPRLVGGKRRLHGEAFLLDQTQGLRRGAGLGRDPQLVGLVRVLLGGDLPYRDHALVDIDKRMVTVRQVAAEKHPDKTYQLWIATQPGTAPQSLGLIEKEGFTVKATLAAYEPRVINEATFGISLEPEGGSPTGQPTSPAIHAKLLQVTPPQNP